MQIANRLTNAMMTNTTLMHINRNMRNLDEIIRQIETTKRVGTPSDDPLVASRALKFRTSVHENEQFRRNVNNGLAWLNVSESAFTNINQNLLAEIRTLAVAGAHGTYNPEQMLAMVVQMNSFFQEIGSTINQRFAGQFVFSGFRTDQPPVFNENSNAEFVITQHFNLSNIERAIGVHWVAGDAIPGLNTPTPRDINVMKLAFTSINAGDLRPPAAPGEWHRHIDNPDIHIPGFHVRMVSINDPLAYSPAHMSDDADLIGTGHPDDSYLAPPRPVIHLIAETGELVMHNATLANFPREGISVTYRKEGFAQGELNPAVYFTSRQISDTPSIMTNVERVFAVTQYLNRDMGDDTFTGNVPGTTIPATRIPLASLTGGTLQGAPVFPPDLPPGAIIQAGHVYVPTALFDRQSNISVTYNVLFPATAAGRDNAHALMNNLEVQGVRLVRALQNGVPVPLDVACTNRSFDMHNQEMTSEFAANTHVRINSLAKDILTDHMFADFRRLYEFANSVNLDGRNEVLLQFFQDEVDPTGAASAQLDSERSIISSAFHRKFNNMMHLIDGHMANATREQTLLGARMVRLELIQNRLESDEVTLTDLMSDNEDTDMIRAIILRASAEAAFMASLHANTGVVQMSLAQFIR